MFHFCNYSPHFTTLCALLPSLVTGLGHKHQKADNWQIRTSIIHLLVVPILPIWRPNFGKSRATKTLTFGGPRDELFPNGKVAALDWKNNWRPQRLAFSVPGSQTRLDWAKFSRFPGKHYWPKLMQLNPKRFVFFHGKAYFGSQLMIGHVLDGSSSSKS